MTTTAADICSSYEMAWFGVLGALASGEQQHSPESMRESGFCGHNSKLGRVASLVVDRQGDVDLGGLLPTPPAVMA